MAASSALNVLLIAEACNPQWASVPLVGYSLARALAERTDLRVTLATHVRNRPALEADPIRERARVEFIDNEFIARPLYRLGERIRGKKGMSFTTIMALGWPAYIAFEKVLYRRFRGELNGGGFDLIHRITPLSPTQASPLPGMTDVPMLIGPLNGGLPWPREYPELRGREREWLVPLRGLYKHLPYYRSMYRHLRAVIAASRHTASEIPGWFKGRREYVPENGIDPRRFPIADGWNEPQGRFRFVTIGRLVPYKGIDLILEAMAGSPALRDCELCIIGDGPERGRLEAMARDAGLSDRVEFAGWVDHAAMPPLLRRSQAFVFPSLREFGGGVVLEAMASGLPAIVVDYGGPGELVSPETGLALPMAPREPLIASLRRGMERLASDPDLCRSLARASCRRVRDQFTWAAKAEIIRGIYEAMLA